MTRQEFLNGEWQKYPVFSAAAPPTDESWVAGRLQSVSASSAQIEMNGEPLIVNAARATVPSLGRSAPLAVLCVGDLVVYNVQKQAVFLLAPSLCEESVSSSVEWQMFLHVIHEFFAQNGFIHWLTPSFVASSGVDANIDFFVARGVRTGREYRLPTSPEFELKKAMVQGVELIYEIKNCYRDDDPTPIHKSEFTMLEWYRSFATIDEIERDVVNLVNTLIESFALPYDAFESFKKYSMAELFKTYLSYELTPKTTAEELQQLLEHEGLEWSPSDDWNDLFFRVYVDRIEPRLQELGPIIVNGFPAQQRSLSRLTAEGWADRFEFYWNGVEIANCYHEENDPEKIAAIIDAEAGRRVASGRAPLVKDPHFLAMMERGFPPSAGIALGLERLFMCLRGESTIL